MEIHSFAAYFNDASDTTNSEIPIYDANLNPKLARLELSPQTSLPFNVEHYLGKTLQLTGAHDFTVNKDDRDIRFYIPLQNLQIVADENRICLSCDRYGNTVSRPA